jgi:hypothetical protein
VAAEIFCVGVEEREAADRAAHQRDAGEAGAASVGGIARRYGGGWRHRQDIQRKAWV